MKKIKRIVIFTLFLDILGLTVIVPAFPDLVDYYRTDYIMISLGVTLFSLFGLFSTPILGAISDKYGRKPVLLVSVISTFLSYVIICLSGNVRWYLVARIVSGMAAGNIGAIQSILSDIATDHKERTANLGIFGAVFGLGFIVGPAIGGWLLGYGVKMPFVVSGILSFLNIVFIIYGLPETNKLLNKTKKITINIVRIFKEMFVSHEKKYYLVFLIVNFAIMIYQMSFTLYLDRRFGIGGNRSGYIMAMFGVIMIVNQGLLLRSFWLKKFSNKKLLSISLFGMVICYAGSFFFDRFVPVIGFVALSGLFQGIFRPIFQNMILGNKEQVGVINGNVSAISNLTSIFGPIVGGYLVDINMSPFGIIALLILVAYLYAKKHLTSHIA